jgi:hypothetical protein
VKKKTVNEIAIKLSLDQIEQLIRGAVTNADHVIIGATGFDSFKFMLILEPLSKNPRDAITDRGFDDMDKNTASDILEKHGVLELAGLFETVGIIRNKKNMEKAMLTVETVDITTKTLPYLIDKLDDITQARKAAFDKLNATFLQKSATSVEIEGPGTIQ